MNDHSLPLKQEWPAFTHRRGGDVVVVVSQPEQAILFGKSPLFFFFFLKDSTLAIRTMSDIWWDQYL